MLERTKIPLPGLHLLQKVVRFSAPNGYALQAMLNAELVVLEEKFDAERTLSLIQDLKLTHA